MSNALPSRPRQMQQRRTVAIVASQYNSEFVEGLASHAQRELAVLLPNSPIQQYLVPGAFEIPLVVQEIAERGAFTAIIALGVIIRGETEHARLIAEAVTRSLLDITLRFKIPVIHEVLLLNDRDQARQRCLEDQLNRGTEAARVAVRMIESMTELRSL
ncbi:MAG: 6,7-dimethyl-8-ribityllumazine synthase [Chthoniobacteraceae bacterium]|jgi:6,7-dimethyl-8-ribityllumazine synthase